MAFPPQGPILKDPSSDLDYGFDLAPVATQLVKPWLSQGEEVTGLTVTADTGLTVATSGFIANSSGVPASLLIAWLTGGTAGTTYNVHFLFNTNQGRTDARTMQICCVSR